MDKTIILYKAHDARFASHENSLYENLERLIRHHVAGSELGSTRFDVCFVKNNPTIQCNTYDEKNLTYWVAGEENYATALRHKVLEALRYFFVDNDYGYSNVFIANLSTVVNLKQIEIATQKNLPCQSIKGYYSWQLPTQKIIDYFFPSGAGALLSKETVQKYVDFASKNDLNILPNFDDTFLGWALYHLGIQVHRIERLDLLTKSDCERLSGPLIQDYPHIRIKTDPRDEKIELQTHEKIYNAIYGSSS